MYSKKLFIQNTVKSAQQFQHFLKAFKKLVLSIKVTFIDITFFIDKTLIIILNLKKK